jgi:UDP-GlcNAc:undecaprenyl-phosphate GlcNAc-1-phosphate transferase
MLINYLSIIICGFLGGIAFVFILRKFSVRYKVLVTQNVPAIGGIAIGLSFMIACLSGLLFYRSFSAEAQGIIISSFIMLVFGVVDDWKELSIPAKLCAQVAATCVLIIFGVKTQVVYIGNLANLFITFLWVLGITNAFNHLDVIDGVAAGIALIVTLAFFTVSFLNGDIKNTILTLAFSGAILSFLIFNLPPAKIYMGNSGSHFLGFVLAAIALAISYAPLGRKIALFSPILILGFPIFDTVFLVLIRIMQGRSALKKSDDHIALRLLRLGYSKNRVFSFMLMVTFFFSFCGIIVSRAPNFIGIVIIIFVILASLALTKKMSKIPIDA